MDTYADGVGFITGAIFGAFIFLALLEFYFELNTQPPIAERVRKWAERNSWYVSALVLTWSMLLAHFVLHPLPAQ